MITIQLTKRQWDVMKTLFSIQNWGKTERKLKEMKILKITLLSLQRKGLIRRRKFLTQWYGKDYVYLRWNLSNRGYSIMEDLIYHHKTYIGEIKTERKRKND